eukprot:13288667-Alexandrium_andersonii.AAC.1
MSFTWSPSSLSLPRPSLGRRRRVRSPPAPRVGAPCACPCRFGATAMGLRPSPAAAAGEAVSGRSRAPTAAHVCVAASVSMAARRASSSRVPTWPPLGLWSNMGAPPAALLRRRRRRWRFLRS